MVELVHTGSSELVCCGKPMMLMNENTVEAALEKHIPVVEKTDEGVKVQVGSVLHPMDEDHYIEWIEVISEEGVYRKFLKPGDKPEAMFNLVSNVISARAYCNLHGLWKSASE